MNQMHEFKCPNCDEKHYIFGEGKTQQVADKFGLPVLAKLPINPTTASLVDKGSVELADTDLFAGVTEILEKL